MQARRSQEPDFPESINISMKLKINMTAPEVKHLCSVFLNLDTSGIYGLNFLDIGGHGLNSGSFVAQGMSHLSWIEDVPVRADFLVILP
jgi:hypothetical protein